MLNKIKVLHVLASNKYSGAENVVCQIISMFKDDVDMAYTSPSGDIANTLEKKNIEFFPMKKLSVRYLKNVIKQYKPDIIHAHDIRATIIATMAKGKIPVVAHVHGSDSESMKKIGLKSVLFAMACKRVDHIFWVSQSCLDVFRFRKKVSRISTVLYNIISLKDLYERANNAGSNRYDVAYLGRLEPVKNPLRMLQIIKELTEQKPDLNAVIMGDGSLKQDCEQFILKNNLRSNIKLMGFVDNPIGILKNCKTLLLSSISEGTPMCALESLGLGVPVVSTPTDGLVDIIENGLNGFLYKTNDEAVNYLIKIINNELDLKNNCIAWSNNFNNIEIYKNKINQIYNNLVE